MHLQPARPSAEEDFNTATLRTYPPRVVAVACSTLPINIAEYLSELEQLFSLQHEYPGEAFFAISDNDSFAREQPPDKRREAILDAASACLALGLDEKKTILYRQSDLPQALELLWHTPCIVHGGLGDHYGSELTESSYLPVDDLALFAANGLGLRATIMAARPAQVRSCEYARRLAQTFNDRYGRPQVLTYPATRMVRPRVEIPNLARNTVGGKSFLSFLSDHRQLENELTLGFAGLLEKTPRDGTHNGLSPLHQTVCLNARTCQWSFNGQSITTVPQFGRLARRLAVECVNYFLRAAARYEELRKHPDYVWDVLRDGAHLACQQVEETLDAVRNAIGAAQPRTDD